MTMPTVCHGVGLVGPLPSLWSEAGTTPSLKSSKLTGSDEEKDKESVQRTWLDLPRTSLMMMTAQAS